MLIDGEDIRCEIESIGKQIGNFLKQLHSLNPTSQDKH